MRAGDIDAAHHLNHVSMLVFLEHGRVGAHAQVREQHPELPNMATAVRRLTVDYLGQTEAFARLTVRSWVRRDGGSSRTWEQELVREDGVVICRAEVVSVLVDLNSGRPTRLPEVYRHSFADFTEPAD